MATPRCAFVSLVFGAIIFHSVAAVHAAPAPALAGSAPIVLQKGTATEVAINGESLANVTSQVDNPRGVGAELIKSSKPDSHAIHLKITADANAAPGPRQLRLIAPSGVTRPIDLIISQYPVVSEHEPNNTPQEAQQISLPVTLVGRMDAPGDVDQFQFHAAKDQTLVFDIDAVRLGSQMDPVATIHSADGREMRTNLEHRRGDPLLVFHVPEDGDYRLRLRDLEYRGGAGFDYRVTAGAIPYIEALLPSSGRPGSVIHAQAIGYNLQGDDKITIDLTNVAPGRIEVRAKTPAGLSNPIPFEVTELPQAVESEPNNDLKTANPITLPTEVSAHVDRPGDEDFFKFHVPYKQLVHLEVLAARFGSPVMPLLELRNTHGDVIERNDGARNADAEIIRELDPGDYFVSLRDLTYAGGDGYWYRLKVEPASRVQQDFSVRFLPDAPRLHRGGNVAMWCEVMRQNGFRGTVTLAPEGLPPGVTAPPIVIDQTASGWFTLAASPDAAMGSTPFRIRATAMIDNVPVSHDAEPELDGKKVESAYLTVLDPAPFNVEAVADFNPQQLQQMNGQIGALAAKINAPDPRYDSELAAWEQKVVELPGWTVVNPATASSVKGTPLVRQPDGSFMASGNMPPQDIFTLTARSDLKGITAVRLEVLADPRLPGRGPGAAPNGNFVLSEFKLLASKQGQPPQPASFKSASADYSQPGFPVENAIDNNSATGWAVAPAFGVNHTAVFVLAKPIDIGDGTELTFVLEHMSGVANHITGRFRLSITTADPLTLFEQSQIPPAILDIVSVPREDRSSSESMALNNYFRTINPDTAADRAQLDALRRFAEPYAQLERLNAVLAADSPELAAEQAEWEKSVSAGNGWSILPVAAAQSAAGAHLDPQPDGSLLANGKLPPNDVYTIDAAALPFPVTAIQLETLPDPELANNGPGRSPEGNFIISRFQCFVGDEKYQPVKETPFSSARATFEQANFGIAGTLDDNKDTGWAIAPEIGRPVAATFYPRQPIASEPLVIRIEQNHKLPGYTLGRFRIWVTSNPQPDAALRPPEQIAFILAAKNRSPQQQRDLALYFRLIARSLEPVRQRLVDLQSQVPTLPLRVEKNRDGLIPVPIHRMANYTGDVQVTLEGFVRGREGNGPAPITKEFQINPLPLTGRSLFAILTLTPAQREQVGTRMVVLKAEGKVGDETIVEYSPAFPLTVEQ